MRILARIRTPQWQQFRTLPAFEDPRPTESLDLAGLTALRPGVVVPAPLSRGHPATLREKHTDPPPIPSSAIDEGSISGLGSAITARLRGHAPRIRPTAPGSRPRRGPAPAPGRSASGPRELPA